MVPVLVEAADRSKPQPAYALADWRTRLEALPDPPAHTRLLSPFDPILRDRGRALRRFAFDYRFEAFTVQSKRRYGYYVLPILEGEQLVGRLDPKLHREESALEIRGLWWEPGVKATRERSRLLHEAVDRLAGFLEAREVRWPLRQRRTPMPSHGPK